MYVWGVEVLRMSWLETLTRDNEILDCRECLTVGMNRNVRVTI